MELLTPRQIVKELDAYIIGQTDAKRAVSIALRNRWRRQQLEPELRDEVAATAAARALLAHTNLPARAIVEEAMAIAAALDVYTNDHITILELKEE